MTTTTNDILSQVNSYIEDAERLLSIFQDSCDTTNELERAQRVGTIKHDLQETRKSICELKGSAKIQHIMEGSNTNNDRQRRIRKILYYFLQNESDVNDLIGYYNSCTDPVDWNTFFSDTDGIYINKIRLLTTSYLIRDQEEEG